MHDETAKRFQTSLEAAARANLNSNEIEQLSRQASNATIAEV
jgi:hypothetical protein